MSNDNYGPDGEEEAVSVQLMAPPSGQMKNSIHYSVKITVGGGLFCFLFNTDVKHSFVD